MDIYPRSFEFAVKIVRLSCELEKTRHFIRPIANQLLRSGTSIGANLEEARAASSRKDFINKVNISLKEARECKYWLKLMNSSGVADVKFNSEILSLLAEADELSRILAKILITSRKNSDTCN